MLSTCITNLMLSNTGMPTKTIRALQKINSSVFWRDKSSLRLWLWLTGARTSYQKAFSTITLSLASTIVRLWTHKSPIKNAALRLSIRHPLRTLDSTLTIQLAKRRPMRYSIAVPSTRCRVNSRNLSRRRSLPSGNQWTWWTSISKWTLQLSNILILKRNNCRGLSPLWNINLIRVIAKRMARAETSEGSLLEMISIITQWSNSCCRHRSRRAKRSIRNLPLSSISTFL